MKEASTLKIFSGNANNPLAREITQILGVKLGGVDTSTFADGEINLQLLENVRGCDCYVVQPTCKPVNQNLMELLVMIDALRRASADRITAVVPYYGYGRADRKASPRVPITAKLVANLLTSAGANRVMCIDLHAGQIQGFFDIPLDHLQAAPVMVEHFVKAKLPNLVVVSPDVGGVERARQFARKLDCGLVIIDKRRPRPNVSAVFNVIGNVEGSTAVIFDDIVDTAGTLCAVAQAVKDKGAARVMAACTHGVLSLDAVSKINASSIEQLIITNTIPQPAEAGPKVKVLSVAGILAEAIKRNHCRMSISEMFS